VDDKQFEAYSTQNSKHFIIEIKSKDIQKLNNAITAGVETW
jgi:hypothetical protein